MLNGDLFRDVLQARFKQVGLESNSPPILAGEKLNEIRAETVPVSAA